MAKCKCGGRTRIASEVVRSMGNCQCVDVCATPICQDPDVLGIMTPMIYDEIGINLCTTFDAGTIPATVTNGKIRVLNATYTYGTGNVQLETLTGRPNCVDVTLTNITVQFALNLYDSACRLVTTLYPTAVYLPSDITAPTYDEDTNPSSVVLQIFAPYGPAYTADVAPTPVVNFVGFTSGNNSLQQGINLFAMAKLLDLNLEESTVTVGLTLVLQSLYFAGYKVRSEGKIDIPKGSIVTPEDSQCLRFVAGDLLNLQIKPLDLGAPMYEEENKQECFGRNICGSCGDGAADITVPMEPTPAP